jgi:hypothetical protein
VQLDGRQVQLEQAHVLHDQRVGAGVPDVPGHAARGFELVVAQDGVQRDEDARAVAVGVAAQALDVGQRVAGLVARAESRAADVHGIGAVVDGLDADGGVARRGQQFEVRAAWRLRGPRPAGSRAAAPSMAGLQLGVAVVHRELRELRHDARRRVDEEAGVGRAQHAGVVVRIARGDDLEVQALERLAPHGTSGSAGAAVVGDEALGVGLQLVAEQRGPAQLRASAGRRTRRRCPTG